MKLSVIIPCFNAADSIDAQLNALANQQCSEPWEIIVADNGSTDQSIAIVEKYQQRIPNLRVVDASGRKGAAYARNIGASVASSESLAFCDADDVVGSEWIAAMIEALSQHNFVAGNSDYSKLNEPWVIKTCEYREANGVKDYPYFPYAAGNNLGVKRWVHDAVGGFDETMLRLQDVDYCWRIQRTGTKLVAAPKALVYFRFRSSFKGMFRRCQQLASYDILLHKKHREMGMPKLMSLRGFVKDTLILPVKFLVKVRNQESLLRWLLDFAWLAGHLQGCIQYKYLPI